MILKNNINNDYDSDPTANIDFDAVGGKSEKWIIIDKLGQNVKHTNPKEWEDKVKIETKAKNLRFDWKLSERVRRAWRDSNPRPIG